MDTQTESKAGASWCLSTGRIGWQWPVQMAMDIPLESMGEKYIKEAQTPKKKGILGSKMFLK